MSIDELQRLLDEAPLHRALRLRVDSQASEALILSAEPGPEHTTDGDGPVHGGVVATMLDTAATFALIAATGSDWSTVDLRVDYLRPTPVAPVAVTGTCVQIGTRLGRAVAVLHDVPSGRLLASANGTFVRS